VTVLGVFLDFFSLLLVFELLFYSFYMLLYLELFYVVTVFCAATLRNKLVYLLKLTN